MSEGEQREDSADFLFPCTAEGLGTSHCVTIILHAAKRRLSYQPSPRSQLSASTHPLGLPRDCSPHHFEHKKRCNQSDTFLLRESPVQTARASGHGLPGHCRLSKQAELRRQYSLGGGQQMAAPVSKNSRRTDTAARPHSLSGEAKSLTCRRTDSALTARGTT